MWWTLVASLVASATAVGVALVVYPYQKDLDRKQQHKNEKRAAYRQFAQQANSFFGRAALANKSSDVDAHTEHYLRVIAASAELVIYAPKEVIVACQEYAMVVFEYSELLGAILKREGYKKREGVDRKELYQRAKRKRKAAMIALRGDLEDDGLGDPVEAMNAFFVLTEDEAQVSS